MTSLAAFTSAITSMKWYATMGITCEEGREHDKRSMQTADGRQKVTTVNAVLQRLL